MREKIRAEVNAIEGLQSQPLKIGSAPVHRKGPIMPIQTLDEVRTADDNCAGSQFAERKILNEKKRKGSPGQKCFSEKVAE